MSGRAELKHIVSSLKDAVKTKGAAGLGASRKRSPAPKAKPAAAAPAPIEKPAPASAHKPLSSDAPVLTLSATGDFIHDATLSSEEKLRRLREEIGDCQRCPLGASRIKLTYGVGNPRAKIMFIGEGPGFKEDREGEPFVGPAGQLLDKILEATGLSRKPQDPEWNWIYIANMVKCHPMIDPSDNTKRGNDRPPTPEEMAVCSPFLMKQIRIIRPLFIVALGGTSGKGLLKTEEGISTFRGKWSDWSPEGENGLKIRFLPTYHPAALLRNPGLKKVVWEDMKVLRAALDKAVGA